MNYNKKTTQSLMIIITISDVVWMGGGEEFEYPPEPPLWGGGQISGFLH